MLIDEDNSQNIQPDSASVALSPFHVLLRVLHESDQTQAELLYQQLRKKIIIVFFASGGLAPEDLADQTLERVAHLLAAGKTITTTIEAFAHGVARNILHEARRQSPLSTSITMDGEPALVFDPAPSPEQALLAAEESETRLRCMKKCWGKLPANKQALLQTYFRDDPQKAARRQWMNQFTGRSAVGLRTEAHRLRKRLRDCYQCCCGAGAQK